MNRQFALGAFMLSILLIALIVPAVLSQRQSLQVKAPGDHIRQDEVLVYDDHVRLDITGASTARFQPTGSMQPFLDERSQTIQIVPQHADDIDVGDVIVYRYGEEDVIHRVVEIREDRYVVRGDNNKDSDPYLVPFEAVTGVVVAVIY